MPSVKLLTLAVLASAVCGQQTMWGQCGGMGWTGPTTCVSGAVCTYSNAWYSQCLPASSTASSSIKATSSTSTTKPPTTLFTSTKSSSTTSKPATTTSKTSTTSSKTTSSTQPAGTGGYQYLISFGDSYTQTGFVITGGKPSSSNPLGNPAYPGYTTAGGPHWLDDVISVYNHSLLLSYNFAYGGATTDATLVIPYTSTVQSFVDQVTIFSDNLAAKPSYAPWTSSNTLFAVWIGVNDVGNAWYASNWATLAPQIVARYFSQVQILYNAGARNFVFLSVPPIQRTPLDLTDTAADQASIAAAVVTYNNLIANNLATFKSSNSEVKAWIYDTAPPFNTVLDNPTAYGAPDNTCVNADGLSCLWYNNYHPGQKIHDLVAKGVQALVGS